MTIADGTLVALVAARNEEHVIAATLAALMSQERVPDRVVVAADNCTDGTVEAARSVPGVIVFETEDNTDRKVGALNQAWRRYAADADLVVCVDADTILPPSSLGDWEAEFAADERLAGCSAKFTMLVTPEMTFSERLLVRMQRAEFSKWTDVALKRGRRTSVLAGTACCLRNDALHQIVDLRRALNQHAWSTREIAKIGPWTHHSMVEDFELTYQLRTMGWETKVSATVRAYTDAMTNLRSLWAQRMKWQTGTVRDLLTFGFNRQTLVDWWQQLQGGLGILVRMLWVLTWVLAFVTGSFQLHAIWLIAPAVFIANDIKQAMRIPDRRPADIVTAASLVPQEFFAFMRAGWFTASWVRVLGERVLGRQKKDLWQAQAQAEQGRRVSTEAVAA